MKKMRKAAAVTLALALIFAAASVLPARAAQPQSPQLRFGADGRFTVLQITDTQDSDQLHRGTAALIEAALDTVQPDLVVFTGDNTAGWWLTMNKAKMAEAIDDIVGPVDRRGIPFAVVPGNHDGESIKALVTLKDQLEIYQSYPTCLAVDDGALTGCSTYNLLVDDSAGKKPLLNIYMVDSGGFKLFGGSGEDVMGDDQVRWYREKSEELKALNGGVPLPSIVFQHIPVPEFYTELMDEAEPDTPGAIEGKGAQAGRWYLPDESKHLAGTLGERPCVANINKGFYSAWVEQGDVFAAFFGHDHNNDYVGRTDDGIVMGYCRGTGFHVYGQGTKRGVRAFTFYEDDVAAFDTQSILYEDIVSTQMPRMPVYTSLPWMQNYDFAPDLVRFFSRLFTLLGRFALLP
ncbi:MAG TPA: metallophosphoesterase family protein [Clostridiales bacterium]|nr:MAG: Calcineurin-like phosphoesterase [Firmicutes bacterium ADurb.Bin262]HOU11186.1 metallophosphoesterase family protein [Clostridiales bacterium]HQH64269.1 metallophosphoesterase family protein [Clostridiales bacterium]HQK74333.1 metallophosphoesterase family protein [Clostridiales bacterium]